MAYSNLLPFQLITSGNMNASITSDAVYTQYQDNIGIQLNWTGVPVGTFDVQISMDHHQDINGNITVAGNWTSLPLSPAIAASGGADTAYIDLNQQSAPYFRVVYTRTSGTGTLNVFATAKGI